MPYIKQEDRPVMDEVVKSMLDNKVEFDGKLNYVLFSFCKRYMNIHGESYNNYKNFIGELNECVAEIRRTSLADYENCKIRENGDVYGSIRNV